MASAALFSWTVLLGLSSVGSPSTIRLEVGGPEPLILGELAEVPVTFDAPEDASTTGRPLRVSVNVGDFGPVERVSAGKYRATYHLPKTLFPQVALVAVWRETGPDAEITFLRIPLFGRTELPVRARPGSELKVLVRDQEFGPWTVPPDGRVRAAIVVPPGVREVVAQSQRGTYRTQATVDANVPPYNRLTLAVTPYLIPSDGVSAATVHVFYDQEEHEAPLAASRIRLKVPSGTLAPSGQAPNRFRYVPARSAAGTEVTLRAEINGDRASRAEAVLSLGVPVPERIVARLPEQPWQADGRAEVAVTVLVLDRLGLGVPKLPVTATVSGGAVKGVREANQGEYEITLSAPSGYPAGGEVTLGVRVPHDRGVLTERILVPIRAGSWPTHAELATDPSRPAGGQPFALLVTTFDAAGSAITGVKLALRAEGGASGPVTELGGGRYRAEIAPDPSAAEVALDLGDETGRLHVRHVVPLRRDRGIMTLGARVGAGIAGGLVGTGGLELNLRPGLLEDRLELSLGAGAWYRTRSFAGDGVNVSASLFAVPVSLLARFDLYDGAAARLYAGAGPTLVFARHSMESNVAPGLSVGRAVPGFELVAGGELSGFFLELALSVAGLSSEGFVVSPLMGSARFGYRWEVL